MSNPGATENAGGEDRIEEGRVVEALPNATFRVELSGERKVLAYLSGKMRLNRIRVLVGDKVEILVDKYQKLGRITRRL